MIPYHRVVKTGTEDVYIGIDGNQFVAVFGDFIDLAVSPAGFGGTEEEAVSNLILTVYGE